MNTQLRTKVANEFEKHFYKLCNNSVYGKTMENVREHRDIRLVRSDKKRNIVASEPNYYSTKCISEDLLIMEMKKREIYMNKPIYLGQAILDISKTLMHEFGLIICYLCMMKMSNYAIWIPIVLLFMLKLMIFTKILVMILINGLKLVIIVKVLIAD